jgi:hypothetical protein
MRYALWADGTFCEISELGSYQYMSDDFLVVDTEHPVKPLHQHDCNHCEWLGHGEVDGCLVDYYIHRKTTGATLIIRFSSEPSDYSCTNGRILKHKQDAEEYEYFRKYSVEH